MNDKGHCGKNKTGEGKIANPGECNSEGCVKLSKVSGTSRKNGHAASESGGASGPERGKDFRTQGL